MKNVIHKKYKDKTSYVRGTYEIVAQDGIWYIIYAGYIVKEDWNKSSAEENFETAKNFLFAKPDCEFIEID